MIGLVSKLKSGLSTFEAMKHVATAENSITLDDERLHALQSVLTMILSDVVSVCEKHDFSYVVGGGTCLGAVRHKGFIPWDDDIDLNMSRENIAAFLDELRSIYPGKYAVQNPQDTHDIGIGSIRLRLEGTTFKSHSDFTGDSGVFIDIFPIENVPNNIVVRAIYGSVSMVLGLIVSCRRFSEHADNYLHLAKDKPNIARVFNRKIAIGRLFSFRSLDAWSAAWDRWNSHCRDRQSKYVTIPTGKRHYFGALSERNGFFPVCYEEFEGIRVAIPRDYDAYLKRLYGPDYMTPPNASAREVHVLREFDLGQYAICKSTESEMQYANDQKIAD